jgi:conjugative relaxase-like TrwC/TraI family protein
LLTISKALSSAQAQTYHAKEFTSAEQNYWKQDGAVVGEWQGRLAERFGLAGAVDAQHFARLSEGQNPITGEQLVRHRSGQSYSTVDGTTVKPVAHRAGWDATFSAAKSVSLTALVGGDERVREAHRHAVTTALTELERYTQARIGGNHAAETTGKFIAAKFEHDTARPVNGYAAPQLHTHAVVFNMTDREDGSTRAIQPKSLFDSQQFATAVYQAELTFRLRNLGYEIETGKRGAPEIKGYSQEYLDASSPRRQQIEQAMAKSGFSGPEAAQIAAHNTRDKKQILTPTEVIEAHRQLAAKFGNQADRVVAEARERAYTQEQNRVPDAPQRAQEAVTYAKERNFEREAVIDQRDIMRDALRRGMGDLTFSQVRDNFEHRHAIGEFQTVQAQKHNTGTLLTTPETIAAERATVEHMQRGQNTVRPIMNEQRAASHAAAIEFLNPAQRRAIEEILTSRDQIHGLEGLAGVGKTTTLAAVREAAQHNGYESAFIRSSVSAGRNLQAR